MAEKARTYIVKDADQKSEWFRIDASGKVLGRIATKAAQLLMGKHRPTFSPHQPGADFVVVTNAAKVKVTGKKEEQKSYFRHSGYPGGDRHTPLARVRELHPERMIQAAVSGMLPKNRLRTVRLARLKVFRGADNPYSAQTLVEVTS